LDWIIKNSEWLFSGIAVAVPLAVLGWFFVKKSNKQVQKSGSYSTNIQVGGNVTIKSNNADE